MDQKTQQELLQIIEELQHENSTLKQYEKARNPAENYIHEILHNIAAPIFLKDSQGVYLYSNSKYAEVIDVLPADIIGKTDFDVVPQSVAALFRSQDQEVIRKNAPLEFEETIPLPDGIRSFITAKFPLHRKDGAIFAVGGYCTEITERKKAEAARVKLIEELHAAQYQIKQEQVQNKALAQSKLASLGQLAADIAHEVNTPLGSIKNYLSVIKRKMRVDDSETIKRLDIIDEEINRIANITKGLLTFSRPESKDEEFININKAIESVVGLVRHSMKKNGVELDMELDLCVPEIKISSGHIKQVMINLINNSLDAMPEKGELAIRTVDKKDGVIIDVEDSGKGIKEEDINKLFTPFYTTKGEQGTGLGLAISYGIVKGYGGNINLRSKEDKGVIASVYLPY